MYLQGSASPTMRAQLPSPGFRLDLQIYRKFTNPLRNEKNKKLYIPHGYAKSTFPRAIIPRIYCKSVNKCGNATGAAVAELCRSFHAVNKDTDLQARQFSWKSAACARRRPVAGTSFFSGEPVYSWGEAHRAARSALIAPKCVSNGCRTPCGLDGFQL